VRIDEHYDEYETLAGGRVVHLRTIRPSDKDLMREGFERLGPQSRYARFFTGKKELHDADLVYLTEVDGVDHVALVAGENDEHGVEHGLGVARFVRCLDDPHVAEPAIAIVDDAQGLGLGGLMLRRLTDAARERDIWRFRCPVLANNEAMQALLAEIQPDVRRRADAPGVTLLEIALPGTPATDGGETDTPPERGSGLYTLTSAIQRLLASVARQAVAVPYRFRGGSPPDDTDPLP
jgi:GNAT superfamily N-acetyltransferase